MSDKRSFLRQFWKEKKMVGAMSPSSRFLAKKMLESVDFESARIIVDLGPGTGVLTRRLLDRVPDELLAGPVATADFTTADEARERYARYLTTRLEAPRAWVLEAVGAREQALREPPRRLQARR